MVYLAAVDAVEKQDESAEKEFETALQVSPHYTPALDSLSQFLVSRNRRSEAITRTQRFLVDSPNDAGAHLILGWLQAGGKQYTDAEAEFQRAIRLDPRSNQAYLELGNLYWVQGDIDRAIAQYKKLLVLNPKLVAVQVLVGNLYLQNNDLGSARQYYEAALASDPHSGLAGADLAWLYVLQGGDLNVALGLAQDAKRQLPNLPSVSDTLAWIYYLKGNYRNALPLLRECVQKVPESATYRYHLGMAEVADGDMRSARSELEAALRLKLAGDDAVRARQTLQQMN